jgi:hypothetical protein
MVHHSTRPSDHRLSDTRRLSYARRSARSYRPRLGWLEDRILLAGLAAGASALDVAAEAVPLRIDSTVAATIAPYGVAYYQISSSTGGKLSVMLEAPSFPARVSLVDGAGQPLVQSDGSVAAGNGSIDVNVPAGNEFIEVQSLGGGGAYQIGDDLIPTDPAFQPVPTQSNGYYPIAVGDLDDNGVEDLITADGIHLGVGDGTFESTVVASPLGESGWSVTAITVVDSSQNGLPEIAFTEISPDGCTAHVCVLQNEGGDQFQLVDTFVVDPDPISIQPIDLGNGIVDLAVADYSTGAVATFVGDGNGGYTPGPILYGGSYPVAMVAGQFGDGHVDLIVADQGDPNTGEGQGLTVFQNDGPGQFQHTATIPLEFSPSALVAGDFGNGNLDLAIADSNDDDVSVFLGNGDGTFQSTPSTYAVGSDPQALVACSLRNDGRLDLVTANEDSDEVSVLLGNGNGTFQPQLRFQAGSSPGALVAADFNGDGRPDLAISDRGSGDISVLLGRGDGTFEDQGANSVGNGPLGVVTADLNHDGHLDVITANYYSNDISVLLGNGDGTFQAAESFAAGVGPTALVVGDFNGDGRLDVAVADSGNGNADDQGVSILLGNGDGTFRAPVFYAAGSYPSSIVEGDFTGNGVLDLAVANTYSDDVSILLGNGDGGFQTLPPIPLGDLASEPVSIVAGDFTGDGLFDLAVLNEGTDNISILQGNGKGGFQALLPPVSLDDPSAVPQAMAAGEFTGNGVLDLAVASAGSSGPDTVSILLGEGQGVFDLLPPISLGMGLNPTSIIAAPLFGSGSVDLAVADQAYGTISLLQGDGQGGFLPPIDLDLGSGEAPNVVATGDFTGDGELDLAIGLQDPNNVAIELNQGDGQFAQPASVGLVPQNTPLVADLNGDGVADVTIVDGAGDILFRQGVPDQPGTFEPPITLNPGDPSRDIAAVVTSQGTLLASVDAEDNAVSLFAYGNGRFSRVGSLATGLEPAQIVSANLDGSGADDLIIRNVGDGTLTIDMSNGQGGFLPPIDLAVGSGISDISVADINQDGRPDILLANQTSGEVEVILNLGDGEFSTPTLYRAGIGLSAVVGGTGTTPLSLDSQDGTVGVAAAALTPGGPTDLVALNSGAETLGVLTGLGGGRFANPYSLPTTGPTSAIRVADLTGDGNADLAILGPDGLTIWLGDGKGGFVPGNIIDVGSDPTGLTIADVNGDKLPDLLVGNAFGDVLVLLNEGHGVFKPPTITDQSVSLAVAYPNGSGTPTFIFADQARDRVIVQTGPLAQPTVLADRTTGLLVPSAPVLADLNGDGIPDLIVANTGGNDVLVYPGLPGGGFGPALNDGNGFPVGTNPVAVIVANLNGHPDLIVADKGSNDVSILLNEPEGNSFTFVPGPRLRVGAGPVALLYGDFYGNGSSDLLVSDSGSNNLMLLPSLGNGFFNDVDPTVIPLSESPGPIFAGHFGVGPGPDIVALNPGTGDVTMISGLSIGVLTTQLFSSGGLDPIAAFAVQDLNGFEDLVVANNADGHVALLAGGPQGLTLEEVNSSLDLLNPTGLALASLLNNNLEVYATTEGEETASLLVFSLGGQGTPSSPATGESLTLLPLRDSSLPLIATLLAPFGDPNATSKEPDGAQQAATAFVALSTTTSDSLGQGPFGNTVDDEDQEEAGEDAAETIEEIAIINERPGSSPWRRVEIGLEEAFDEFRRDTQTKPLFDDVPDEAEGRPLPASQPDPLISPSGSVSQVRKTGPSEIVDAAIDSLAERTPISPAVPTIGYDGPEGITKVRLESRPLTSIALSFLQVGLLLISVRPTRGFHPARGIPAWRTRGARRSPEGRTIFA